MRLDHLLSKEPFVCTPVWVFFLAAGVLLVVGMVLVCGTLAEHVRGLSVSVSTACCGGCGGWVWVGCGCVLHVVGF